MKVVFHTGMVKTGSTFIQEMVRENRNMLAFPERDYFLGNFTTSWFCERNKAGR